jgi:hypothetical protein
MVDIYQILKKFVFLIIRIKRFFYHEDGGRYFLGNICEFLPDYKALHPTKLWATVLTSIRIK